MCSEICTEHSQFRVLGVPKEGVIRFRGFRLEGFSQFSLYKVCEGRGKYISVLALLGQQTTRRATLNLRRGDVGQVR